MPYFYLKVQDATPPTPMYLELAALETRHLVNIIMLPQKLDCFAPRGFAWVPVVLVIPSMRTLASA